MTGEADPIEPGLRPDPARGIFSTALVVRGEVVALDDHLQRLAASARLLYGAPLPEDLPHAARGAAAGIELARLRLTLAPQSGGVVTHIASTPISPEIVLPAWDRALRLRSVEVAGWAGAHKFADRRLLEALDGRTAPEAALLVDPGGHVLETTRANLFLVDGDGTLCTPPLDGRVLPGIARGAVLELARDAGVPVRERALGLTELVAAREVFTTGSVRGIEGVAMVDGVAVPGPGPVSTRLGHRLAARWFGDDRPAGVAPAVA